MAIKTSWKGTTTKELQKKYGHGYARYKDRSRKIGKEFVKPKGDGGYWIIDAQSGKVSTEQKYNNYNGNELTANRISSLRQPKYRKLKKLAPKKFKTIKRRR